MLSDKYHNSNRKECHFRNYFAISILFMQFQLLMFRLLSYREVVFQKSNCEINCEELQSKSSAKICQHLTITFKIHRNTLKLLFWIKNTFAMTIPLDSNTGELPHWILFRFKCLFRLHYYPIQFKLLLCSWYSLWKFLPLYFVH